MIKVSEISLSFRIEIIVFQWPSPAVHIIILSNPGWTKVTPINCVNQSVHFLHVINGGQISVILPAVSLSFSPAHRLIHKVILTGWCWCCQGREKCNDTKDLWSSHSFILSVPLFSDVLIYPILICYFLSLFKKHKLFIYLFFRLEIYSPL